MIYFDNFTVDCLKNNNIKKLIKTRNGNPNLNPEQPDTFLNFNSK